MKTLLILRHAKSDWDNSGLADFDRPLAKRGQRDAPVMGEVLTRFDCVPDRIISSPALRARQTAELVAEACGYPMPIFWEDAFYGGSSQDVIRFLQSLPAPVERPLLIGHNPMLEETVSILLRPPGPGRSEYFGIRIPTAGLICLELDIVDWGELEPGDAILCWFLIPKLADAIR
jgi:phosphohistidine phosphatase